MICKREGFTLIEVILAMAILSILLITYITIFGQNAIIIARGKKVTTEIFDYQEIMENLMVEGKRDFIESKGEPSYFINIFSNYNDYESTVGIKEIETEIKNNRKFTAYVTNFEIKEPESPKLKILSIEVYDSKGNKVFPWFDDNIKIKVDFEIEPKPKIFENKLRWYRSKEGIYNPVFPSEYDVIKEVIQDEPNFGNYSYSIEGKELKTNRFYYFEAKPYTLAGKVAHYITENRILILNKAGSQEWQKFIEDIYFEKFGNGTVKIFSKENNEIYLDIFQNPEHPTLNLDWSIKEDPQGPLLGISIPDMYLNKDFQVEIDFQIDSQTLLNASEILGMGVGLVDDRSVGLMITLDALKNRIDIHRINSNGKYENINSPIYSIDLQSKNFREFLNNMNGNFDWNKKYSLIIKVIRNDKLMLQLKNDNLESDLIEINIKDLSLNPMYIGLKSYSEIDYKPNARYEIISKYDRNYSSHFYDVVFNNIKYMDYDWIIGDNYYAGNSHVIKGGSTIDLRVKMSRPRTALNGNTDPLIAKAFWFTKEIGTLTISNNNTLRIIAEEVVFDVPIEFGNSNSSIVIEGIDSKSYPIIVYFKEYEKVRINNGNIIDIEDGGYFIINSGAVTIKGNNKVIYLIGNDIRYIQ